MSQISCPLRFFSIFGFHFKISNDGQNDRKEPKSNLEANNDEENIKKDRPDESNLEETIDRVPDDVEVCFTL